MAGATLIATASVALLPQRTHPLVQVRANEGLERRPEQQQLGGVEAQLLPWGAVHDQLRGGGGGKATVYHNEATIKNM